MHEFLLVTILMLVTMIVFTIGVVVVNFVLVGSGGVDGRTGNVGGMVATVIFLIPRSTWRNKKSIVH